MPVEVEDVLDGPEVAGFVVVSGGIFDGVKVKFMFSGGGDSCAGVCAGSLEALLTVPWGCFRYKAPRPDRLEVLEHRFE